ncbi:phosphoglycerate mutase-like protein [Thelephora ganbajun]|uniref:Phosphoglycerate mutase-like protein n=1 Tax=Thelephora ganbajun TaxID=370292 RepID=A0ACB6ZHF3_THEGA|nr:phosphoglycerate mutase-like protein [Thelephora ganbajun]
MVRGSKGAVVRVYIVRHGETQENRDGIIQGQRDTSLNATGMEQARMVGEALKDAKLGIAFSSDLSRAAKTAEAILLHHPGISLHKQVELRERGMGELEGKRADVILGRAPRVMEPISKMTARANVWWYEAVIAWIKAQDAVEPVNGREATKGRRDVLIVSHGGLIGILLRNLCKGTVRVEKGVRLAKCMNASITVIEIDSTSGKGKMIRYSDVSHLTGPMVEENVDVQNVDALPNE